MIRAVVVGAGVVGSSVAYYLARQGVSVTVVEGTRPASGTTSRSYAWVNANDKPPRSYHDLNAAGVAEHHALLRQFGPGGFHPTGNLELAAADCRQSELRQRVARLESWGYRAELVPLERIRDLAPGLAGIAGVAAFFPDEGWVAAPVLVAQLLAAAERLGARVVFPAAAQALRVVGDRVTGIRTPGGDFDADVVVDCAGPAAGRLLEPLGLAIRRERAPGVLIVSETLPTTLNRAVHADDVYIRPDSGGRILIGSTDVDAMLPPTFQPGDLLPVDSEPVQEMHRRGARLLPLLEGARIETVRVGWRPMPADGFSAVGPLRGLGGYYLGFTHSGVTLGPIIGRLAAEEIASGVERIEFAEFRPDRLVQPAVAPGGR